MPVLNVNDFYPAGIVYCDGTSTPLSAIFSDLAAAQVVYPFATALTDEVDWCAWQKCIDTAYQRDYSTLSNRSTAEILADGKYLVNRTISCYLWRVAITGTVKGVTVSKLIHILHMEWSNKIKGVNVATRMCHWRIKL